MFGNILSFRNAYVLGLIALLFGLSTSEFVISISQVFLALVWLISGNFKSKISRLKDFKPFWILSGIYAIHIVGLLYTTDFDYAFNDLRIKLPFLLLPFFIGSFEPLKRKEMLVVFSFFIAGLLTSTISSDINYAKLDEVERLNPRNASIFINHIRLSIMMGIALLMIIYSWSLRFVRIGVKMVLSFVGIYFVWYLIKFQLITGLALFFVALFVGLLAGMFTFGNKILKLGVLFIGLFSITYLLSVSWSELKYFIQTPQPALPAEPQKTPDGGQYVHSLNNKQLENGNLVGMYNCELELLHVWSQRSDIGYREVGNTGERIYSTMLRYLTSKGVRKDGQSLRELSSDEIRAIENGVTNYRFVHGTGIRKRIYETFWELHNYHVNNDNPSGNSVVMRFEFWKAAMSVIKENPLIGVGTGDINLEMDLSYRKESRLASEYWFKPHNQYLTMGVYFGILGLMIFLGCIILVLKDAYPGGLIFLILLMISISMLTEDTLERQVGATLFTTFIALIPSFVNFQKDLENS